MDALVDYKISQAVREHFDWMGQKDQDWEKLIEKFINLNKMYGQNNKNYN